MKYTLLDFSVDDNSYLKFMISTRMLFIHFLFFSFTFCISDEVYFANTSMKNYHIIIQISRHFGLCTKRKPNVYGISLGWIIIYFAKHKILC